MSREIDNIGIIAGGGQFPMIVADAAKKQGLHVTAVAFEGEADQALSHKVDELVWIKLGQLGKLIKAFKKRNVAKALMAGTITKSKMFGNIQPDLKGLAFLSKFALFHDDNILRALAGELYDEGIEIVSSTIYLPDLLAPEGCLTKRKPGKEEKRDIEIGWKMAKELGRLDIGQCVVIRDKTVLALEAIDGTNATILRGGKIAGEKAVVVKVSKPDQDLRFDVPSVGLETIRSMVEVKAGVLAVEAGKTLIFDRDKMVSLANENKISIISCNMQDTKLNI
ncbi:MAG: UDP-2,3-diacylglucosamine diphosphatase LpxI [Deltaproteobacteria bacterium]|nr:UDP-2,3-diacylglucosamine diphosphatase LpxI [Deltaproteobacteria bacterium]